MSERNTLQKQLATVAKRALDNWQFFWFDANASLHWPLFRLVFTPIFFLFVLSRSTDLGLFYSESGFLPTAYGQSHSYLSLQKSIFHYFQSTQLVVFCHYALLLALVSLGLGLFTRTSAILCFALNLMFINRNPAIQYGADFVSSFCLFYLCFANSGQALSLDRFLGRDRKGPLIANLDSMAFRLLQIQLCVIYFYSGISKLKGTRWWNGSAIFDVFTMEGLVRWDMTFLAYLPDLLVAACYLTLLWEMYFPILIWTRPFRLLLIVFGALMHMAFGIFLNIPFFAAIMVSIYILFLNRNEAERFAAYLKRTFRKLTPPAATPVT